MNLGSHLINCPLKHLNGSSSAVQWGTSKTTTLGSISIIIIINSQRQEHLVIHSIAVYSPFDSASRWVSYINATLKTSLTKETPRNIYRSIFRRRGFKDIVICSTIKYLLAMQHGGKGALS